MITNENYRKYVLDDLNTHKGLFHPVKASFFDKTLTRIVDINKIHPNPEDEFSIESIGPNWGIVSKYEQQILRNPNPDGPIFDEPLIVIKLDRGGYMLLNGHHRWLAAKIVGVNRLPVSVVNITTAEDINKIIKNSTNSRCVTIDLDEVLLSEDKMSFPYGVFYKEDLRENTTLLVREIHRLGFDIWVYTGSYRSESYIKGLFSANNCKVDGVVNGLKYKGKSKKLTDKFKEKYKQIVHVDNSMITLVDTINHNYEIIDLPENKKTWASTVAEKTQQLIK